jgi:hypothetical protein
MNYSFGEELLKAFTDTLTHQGYHNSALKCLAEVEHRLGWHEAHSNCLLCKKLGKI